MLVYLGVLMCVYLGSLLHTVYNDKQRTDVDGLCIINDVFHLRFARGELYVLMPATYTQQVHFQHFLYDSKEIKQNI